MNIVFTLVAAPLIGWFVRSRAAAAAIYLAAVSLLFTFQTLFVLLNWIGGGLTVFGDGIFGPSPTGLPLVVEENEVWSYGVVNLVITLIGLGITVLLGRLRARRDRKRALARGEVLERQG